MNAQIGDFVLFRKFVALVLTIVFATVAFAQSSAEMNKVRAKVQELSLNRDQKVEVKLKDSTKFKGNITNVTPDSFTVSEPKTGSDQTFSYVEVAQVTKSGGGLSTKTWLIIGGVAAGTVATWLIVKPAVCDGGAQTRGIC
jgi:hypothetical protein